MNVQVNIGDGVSEERCTALYVVLPSHEKAAAVAIDLYGNATTVSDDELFEGMKTAFESDWNDARTYVREHESCPDTDKIVARLAASGWSVSAAAAPVDLVVEDA